jgi:hypothetical protein
MDVTDLLLTPAALSQEIYAVLTKQKTVLAIEPAWTFQRREKSLASSRIQIPDHPTSSPVIIQTTTFIHITKKIMSRSVVIYPVFVPLHINTINVTTFTTYSVTLPNTGC